MRNTSLVIFTMALLLVIIAGTAAGQSLTPQEQLGMNLYFDTNLSTPPGQACASCHHPSAGFADPDHNLPVSQGALPQRYGNRNSPSSAYMAYSPNFYYDETEEMYIGGQFWDGRALNLTEQAKGPFLNPLEMHNPNKRNVINKVRQSNYANLFEQVYGAGSLLNVEMAYDQVAEAIAAFEGTSVLNQFSSKYDYYLAGMVSLTPQEMMGLELFDDPDAGNCSACHPSVVGPYNVHPLFTDYSYDNLGVPKNWENPFLSLPPAFNPAGMGFTDYGLGAIVNDPDEMGKFKVPTLRNIAMTSPYMHNGIFETLTEVVNFYNTRDVPSAGWAPPEVPETVNHEELGDLGLTSDEVAAIVAFMETLTDGYTPMRAGGLSPADEEEPAVATQSPNTFSLNPNYPNPFNPTTSISYALPEASFARLVVFDVQGRTVATLAQGWHEAGSYHVTFDGSGLASGVYFYQLQAGNLTQTQKMVLMK
jgi:cytochrome c peroxidase